MTVSLAEATAAARRIAEWPAFMTTDSTYRRDALLLAGFVLAGDTEQLRTALERIASVPCVHLGWTCLERGEDKKRCVGCIAPAALGGEG